MTRVVKIRNRYISLNLSVGIRESHTPGYYRDTPTPAKENCSLTGQIVLLRKWYQCVWSLLRLYIISVCFHVFKVSHLYCSGSDDSALLEYEKFVDLCVSVSDHLSQVSAPEFSVERVLELWRSDYTQPTSAATPEQLRLCAKLYLPVLSVEQLVRALLEVSRSPGALISSRRALSRRSLLHL